MSLFALFQAVCLIWILSEILLGRLTYHKPEKQERDKRSLKMIWITIIISIPAGVFLGLQNFGRFPLSGKISIGVGTFLIALGLAIRWLAILTLRRYFTSNVQILKDHQIVSYGFYSLIRHPAYAGSLLSFLGLGLAFNSWPACITIFVPVSLAFLYRIKVEEEALLKAFGKEYDAYRQRTKKLIPFIY